MNIHLQRLPRQSKRATIGGLQTYSGLTLHTLERLPTDPAHPCVPVGDYQLLPYDSPKHGQTWCLHNPDLRVWGGAGVGHPCPLDPSQPDVWEYVEIHVGNWTRDTVGCILVGMTAAPKVPAVWSSRKAMKKLRADLGREVHTLQIRGDL